ncbi:tRNA (cytosine(72)-C(5))-methyltransferase NSUN6-like isoform X2 [Lycorma delicatula]|uniref:tRNA (cytosine(72)-C(5))-methyltransferase NSUN6-like isoform X2 n=1 Tax=Lycorma delicatula TaxID=130591 RepID=UPI003F5132B4
MINWSLLIGNSNLEVLSRLKESEKNIVKKLLMDKLAHWYVSTPTYTTVRINTFKTTVEHVIEVIKLQLCKQSVDHGVNDIPSVKQDSLLKDCIVIGCWDVNRKLLQPLNKKQNEVIIDIPCGVSVLRGANVFAPGVMAMSPSVKEGDFVTVYADVSKKCLKGFLKYYDDPYKKYIGLGIAKMTRKSLFEINRQQIGIAVEMKETVSGVPSFTLPPELGLLQNYPSILCSHVLNPQSEDLILDMCAAPGNKTTHIASLMKGKGQIIALDKTEKKIERIKENCKNQHLNNVSAYVFDATKAFDGNCITERGRVKAPPYNENTFDRILLDAPCSALGQRPQLSQSLSFKQADSFPLLQKRLFKAAVKLLKPNGTLVFSTCTLLVTENESMVSWVLNEFLDLQLVPAEPIVGGPGNKNCGLTEEQCHLVQKFGPSYCNSSFPHQSDTVGFFIAKFKKIKSR